MLKLRLILIVALCSPILVSAQAFDRLEVPFSVDGQELEFPLAGGLNTPQLSAVDLNNDDILDLFLFDRVGDVVLPFLSDGSSYSFAPEYIDNFPPLTDWVLLRDFDDDGAMDIFAYSDIPGVGGMMVYKGLYENDEITFERFDFDETVNLIFFPLASGGRTQLFVTDIDYPAVDDLDCDGDLDVLTFSISGGYLEFYKNVSVEKGYGRDSLIFELEENCWGGLYESGISCDLTLGETQGECPDGLLGDELDFRHAGSTVLTFDANNDGIKEALIGDLTCQTLAYLNNAGDCETAWLNEQTTAFPDANNPVEIPIFPAAFYLDVTHDGLKDIVAAPNPKQGAEDFQSLWLYENIGSNEFPEFQFVQKDFLVEEMLDMGRGASPTFVDYNADGLMDLVVGNTSFYLPFNVIDSRLFLYENTGTVSSPSFELVDDDYLGLSQFSQTTHDYSPEFGDLDNDGDLDVLIGDNEGKLFYYENLAGAGNPMAFGPWEYFYASLDVGQASTPEIIDFDRDGLPDLLVGERGGNINFFKNIGTPEEPAFGVDQEEAPNTFFVGQIDTRVIGFDTGHSSPAVVDLDDGYFLVTGSQVGRLEAYNNIEGNLYGAYNAVSETYGEIKEGIFSNPDFADINNDGLMDVVVGNRRGGLAFYTTDIPVDVVSSTSIPQNAGIKVFPNPASDQILVQSTIANSSEQVVQLYDLSGKLLRAYQSADTQLVLEVADLPKGIYLVKVVIGTATRTEKVLVQ